MRYGFAMTSVILAAAAATAQQYPTQPFPGSGGVQQFGQPFNPNNYMPNIFNPQVQPLSPYLNLLRGGNPATNYYYGVRPGTIGLGGRGNPGVPFIAGGGNRTLFFPQLAAAPDPLDQNVTGTGTVLPPAGHPVVFNNTLGFFPTPGVQAGSARPGLAGIGTTRPPSRK